MCHEDSKKMEAVQGLQALTTEELASGNPIQTNPTESTSYTEDPCPFAAYEDVVRDPVLFWTTLRNLHSLMKTTLRIPIIAGMELDLHKLFVEVTSRGGIQKVIDEKKLAEVTRCFRFPVTATNASFVLRKHYLSLLNHYEQLYFFKSEGKTDTLATSAAPVAPTSAVPDPIQMQIPAQLLSTSANARTMRDETRSITERLKFGDISRQPIPVHGVIDGKTEKDYLISVRVGMQILRGVVFLVNNNPVLAVCRKRERVPRLLNPTHPKKNKSSYTLFVAEQQARLKLTPHSGNASEIIGMIWKNLTDIEKVYQEMGARDKERYQREMAIYQQRKMGGPLIMNAIPIQLIGARVDLPVSNEIQMLGEDMHRLSASSACDGSTESYSDIEEASEKEIDDSANLVDEFTERNLDKKMQPVDEVAMENNAGGAGTGERAEITPTHTKTSPGIDTHTVDEVATGNNAGGAGVGGADIITPTQTERSPGMQTNAVDDVPMENNAGDIRICERAEITPTHTESSPGMNMHAIHEVARGNDAGGAGGAAEITPTHTERSPEMRMNTVDEVAMENYAGATGIRGGAEITPTHTERSPGMQMNAVDEVAMEDNAGGTGICEGADITPMHTERSPGMEMHLVDEVAMENNAGGADTGEGAEISPTHTERSPSLERPTVGVVAMGNNAGSTGTGEGANIIRTHAERSPDMNEVAMGNNAGGAGTGEGAENAPTHTERNPDTEMHPLDEVPMENNASSTGTGEGAEITQDEPLKNEN